MFAMNLPQVIVMHGGPGFGTFMDKLSASYHSFDVWFRDSLSDFHGIDFTQPMPGEPPTNLMNWKAGEMTREARSNYPVRIDGNAPGGEAGAAYLVVGPGGGSGR